MTLPLISVTAVSNSYRLTTVPMFSEDIGIDEPVEETYFGRLIDRVSAAIDLYLKRTLAKQSYSETFRDIGCTESLMLRHYPITAISSITESGTALTGSDYEYDADSGLVYRLSSDVRSVWTASKIVVAYTAGYVLPSQTLVGAGAAGARTLPYDIENAALIAMRAAYSGRDMDPRLKSYNLPGVVTEEFGSDTGSSLPDAAKAILNPYRRILV